MRELGIKLQQVFNSTKQITAREEAAG
jgi:hypothetical protein